jgi:hypothetical protein
MGGDPGYFGSYANSGTFTVASPELGINQTFTGVAMNISGP